MAEVGEEKAKRVEAERRAKEHADLIQTTRDRRAEAVRAGAEALRQAYATRDEREMAAASGAVAASVDALRRQEAELGTEHQNQLTLQRGLERRLVELEGQTRPLAMAALQAWVPEVKAERDAALARLDGRRPGTITVAECETYVAHARRFYGLCHDLESLGDKTSPRPGWDAAWQLEQRGLAAPEFAPSLIPGTVRDPVPSEWQPLIHLFRQALAA